MLRHRLLIASVVASLGAAALRIQDDANLVIYSVAGETLWESGTER